MFIKIFQILLVISTIVTGMSPEEKAELRLKVIDMFKHGFNSYMKYAYPADELMPLRRHRQSNLMGTILNVHSGDWIVRESGIGAGIDSYYEYLFKAYVLLGEKNTDYLSRFQEHYSSIMSYVQQGVAMVNVHMHQPYRLAKNHMDALLAFWPGLQVMTGDLKPAIELHEMLYQVVKKHKFLPEAFTTDYRIHWNSHPLRPEFVESTYFLYKATNDPHYLEVGRTILTNLEKHARVPCGYAALSDVSTGQHEDRMDSFVLAETFKYLYLLFDSIPHRYIDIDQFIFTTEAHLLPLNLLLFNINDTLKKEFNKQTLLSAPFNDQFQSHQYKEQLRKNIRGDQDMTETVTTSSSIGIGKQTRESHNRLTPSEFSAGDPQHIAQLKQMGIQIQTMSDGRIQLIHNSANAASNEDANDGIIFIQDMMEFMKNMNELGQSSSSENRYHLPLSVIPLVTSSPLTKLISFTVGSAQFGKQLHGKSGIFAQLYVAQPFSGCSKLFFPHYLYSRIGIVRRGDCMFIEKARQLEYVQASGGIIIDHNISLKSSNGAIFSMTGDGNNNVHIPIVLMFKDEAFQLLHLLSKQPNLIVYIGEEKRLQESFYQQMDILETYFEPFNQTNRKWIYGEIEWLKKKNLCSIVPMKLKQLELIIHQENNSIDINMMNKIPIIQFEHVIDANENKSAEEIAAELFNNLNLTAVNFDGQLNNIDAYRSAFDKVIRTALANAVNESLKSNITVRQEQQIEIPIEIITTVKEEDQQQITTTTTTTTTQTTDTREYTEKRSKINDIN
ncbi:unnamed protein product [Rotaria sp. Silwood1]|nr:unnamed protein product [Rotaria sp. Silwood1]